MAIFKVINSFGKNPRAITEAARYILRESATSPDAIEINGYFPYDEINPSNVTQAFIRDKKRWGKMEGRQYIHAQLAFHPEEKISDEEFCDIAREMCQTVFHGYQVCFAVHRDKKHTHIHFLVNSVSYQTGTKFHTTGTDLRDYKKDVVKILKAHNLHVPVKGKNFYGKDLDKDTVISWNKKQYQTLTKEPVPQAVSETNVDMFKLIIVLLEALLHARSIADFIDRMKRNMWKVTWTDNTKHITFESMETGRKFRAANLDKTVSAKFKYIFGNDFVLDKEHMAVLIKVPEYDREHHYDAAYQELIKNIKPWIPPSNQPFKEPTWPNRSALKNKTTKKYPWEIPQTSDGVDR